MNVLQKLNLLDHAGNLSITNIGGYVAIGLIVYGTVHGMPLEQLIAVVGLICNYVSKRHTTTAIIKDHVKEEASAKINEKIQEQLVKHPEVEELKNEIELLKTSLSFLKKGAK